MSCLLWEDVAYASGSDVAKQIAELVPQVAPDRVALMAVEARTKQKLRHVPLFLCREMVRHESHRGLVGGVLENIVRRPDEAAEFLALYWKTNQVDGKTKRSVPAQVKKGLARAFAKFNEYQLAKWNRDKDVTLRDVMFLTHPKPIGVEQGAMWKRLIDDQLKTPDTWEVAISAAKTPEDKRAAWGRLITEDRLGALAFVKNIRGMVEAGIDKMTVAAGLRRMRPAMLLPIDFIRAVKAVPDFTRELEDAMMRNLAEFPKLKGWTILVVDVSGSMQTWTSSGSGFSRLDAAATMAVMAAEMAEHVTIYATAGNDGTRIHKTAKVTPARGFALAEAVNEKAGELGGGGIFTRQCVDYIREKEKGIPDRIIVFSDSQDCDADRSRRPAPFGKRNYIVDVSSHKHGINYEGVWTAEIAGWSEHFMRFVAASEDEDEDEGEGDGRWGQAASNARQSWTAENEP